MSLKTNYNLICCDAYVSTLPRYYCEKDDVNLLQFNACIPSLNTNAKIIVTHDLLYKALKESFVKKLYNRVNIWIEGEYAKDINDSLVIYARELVLIEDFEAAHKHKKITDEEFLFMQRVTSPQKVYFKTIVEKVLKTNYGYSIIVKLKDFTIKGEEKIILNVTDEIYENALSSSDVFNIHVGEKLNVQAILSNSYSFDDTVKLRIINVECIEIDITDDIDEFEDEMISEQNLKDVQEAVNKLTSKEKISVLSNSLKEDIKEKASSIYNSLKRKIIK